MPRKKSIMSGVKQLTPSTKKSKQNPSRFTYQAGSVGFDNPRENIDDNVKTKHISTKNISAANVTITSAPSTDLHATNKQYVDAQISGENHWDAVTLGSDNVLEPYVDGSFISGSQLTTIKAGSSNTTNLDTYYNSSGGGNIINLRASKSDTKGTITPFATGNTIGNIVFRAPNLAGTVFNQSAQIKCTQDGAASSYAPGKLTINTFGQTTENTNQLVLAANGNVGIGTATPERDFQIAKPANAFLNLKVTGGAGTDSRVEFGDDADLDVGWIRYNHQTDYMDFRVGASICTTMLANGNVGIGTATPSARLEVGGNLMVSGGNLDVRSTSNTEGDLVVDTTNKKVLIGRQSTGSGDNSIFVFRDRLGNERAKWYCGASQNFAFGNFNNGYGIHISTDDITNNTGDEIAEGLLTISGGSCFIENYGSAVTPRNHGGHLIVSGGALIYVGSNGTTTTLAPA